MSYSVDYNTLGQQTIATTLGLVPAVGPLLSALVFILWPQSKEDVWGEIRQQVEQLVDEKIDTLVYQQATDDLSGLKRAVDDYISALSTEDNANISVQWIATETLFDDALPHFRSKGYEVLLLPLFAQFANLNLSLLRDGVMAGATWGWNQKYVDSTRAKLTKSIADFYEYSQTQYDNGLQKVISSTPPNYHLCQPFVATNKYVRQMTLTVLDFSAMWQYFDYTNFPHAVPVYLGREIYSDPMGTCDDSGPITLPGVPSQPMAQLTVWAWDRIDAVQVTYPEGGGPGGVTQTPRMGDESGGSNEPPHGGVFDIAPTNPITEASGVYGDILNALQFTFADGTTTGLLGGNYPGGGRSTFSFPNEILSSVHINGISKFYGSADCAVFGFKFAAAASSSLATKRVLYVTSPAGIPLSSLASGAGVFGGERDLTTVAAAEGWDQSRELHWAGLRSGRE